MSYGRKTFHIISAVNRLIRDGVISFRKSYGVAVLILESNGTGVSLSVIDTIVSGNYNRRTRGLVDRKCAGAVISELIVLGYIVAVRIVRTGICRSGYGRRIRSSIRTFRVIYHVRGVAGNKSGAVYCYVFIGKLVLNSVIRNGEALSGVDHYALGNLKSTGSSSVCVVRIACLYLVNDSSDIGNGRSGIAPITICAVFVLYSVLIGGSFRYGSIDGSTVMSSCVISAGVVYSTYGHSAGSVNGQVTIIIGHIIVVRDEAGNRRIGVLMVIINCCFSNLDLVSVRSGVGLRTCQNDLFESISANQRLYCYVGIESLGVRSRRTLRGSVEGVSLIINRDLDLSLFDRQRTRIHFGELIVCSNIVTCAVKHVEPVGLQRLELSGICSGIDSVRISIVDHSAMAEIFKYVRESVIAYGLTLSGISYGFACTGYSDRSSSDLQGIACRLFLEVIVVSLYKDSKSNF